MMIQLQVSYSHQIDFFVKEHIHIAFNDGFGLVILLIVSPMQMYVRGILWFSRRIASDCFHILYVD